MEKITKHIAKRLDTEFSLISGNLIKKQAASSALWLKGGLFSILLLFIQIRILTVYFSQKQPHLYKYDMSLNFIFIVTFSKDFERR